jgi:putative FmdB family regulatory protein
MPVYEYACDSCGERFELFLRSHSKKACPVCPKCGSSAVHKSISLFGVAGGTGAGRVSADTSCGPGPV